MTPEQVAARKAEFEEWFVKNYPPNCIIGKPEWHAPKIFRAATRDMADLIARQAKVIEAAEQLYRATEFLADNDPDEVVCDGGGTAILVGLSGIRKALAAYHAAREKLHD